MDSFCRFLGDSSEKFPHQEIRRNSLRSERVVRFQRNQYLIYYSYRHLVHSFIAEMHCKLYISLIRL